MARKNNNEDAIIDEDEISNKVLNDKIRIAELRKQIAQAEADLIKAETEEDITDEVPEIEPASNQTSSEELRIVSNEQLLHLKLDKILSLQERILQEAYK